MSHSQTRRGAMLGALAAAAAPMPAGAITSDPIYVAISRHCAAFAVFCANITDATHFAAIDALQGLSQTKPATLAGVVALLDHMHELEANNRFGPGGWSEYPDDVKGRLIGNVRTALAKIAAESEAGRKFAGRTTFSNDRKGRARPSSVRA